jgi:hypothetical protein
MVIIEPTEEGYETGRTERADAINFAIWAVLAGSCFYLGRFIPSGKCVEEVGRHIDECFGDGESTWSTKFGQAAYSLVRNIPASTRSTTVIDEMEHHIIDDDDDYDDDDDDYSDSEVINYE